MKMESEITVMLPQSKEHLGLPEAEKGSEGSSFRGFGGSITLLMPWSGGFKPLELEYISVVLT